MAAVVRTIIAKRGLRNQPPMEREKHPKRLPDQFDYSDEDDDGGENASDSPMTGISGVKDQSANSHQQQHDPLMAGDQTTAPSSVPDKKKIIKATRIIQSWYRGFKVRLLFRKIFDVSIVLSPRSVNKTLHRMVHVHYGWSRFLLHLLLLGFFIGMVCVQLLYPSPSGENVNQSILALLETANFDPSTDVTRSQQIFDYVEALTAVMNDASNPSLFPLNGSGDAESDTECRQVYDAYCIVNNTAPPRPNFLTNLTQCLNAQVEYSDGYLDNQNRLQFGLFLAQQRYDTIPCAPYVMAKNPLSQLPGHQCVDAHSQTTEFISEICGTPSAPTSASCYRTPEFIYNNITRAFTAILNAGNLGDSFGLEYTKCRVDRLKELGWLDYRTKQVCLLFFTFNQNGQGRLAAFRACFRFTVGGKVEFARDLASLPFSKDDATVIGVTSAFIGVFFIWSAWEARDLYAYHASRRTFWPPRARDVLVVVLFGLCLTDVILFFPLYFRTGAYSYAGQADLSQFAKPDEFWTSMLRFLHLLQDWQNYFVVLAITMFFFIARTLTVLDFHPSLGIVSGTLKLALGELASFLFVYAIILISYACLGMLFFGANARSFSSFGTSLTTLIYVSFMDLQDVGLLALDPEVHVGMFESSNWIFVLWYYSFIVIVSILLLNVLLSIVVGGFVDFQERRKERTQRFDLLATLRISMHIWKRYWQGKIRACYQYCQTRRKKTCLCNRNKATEQSRPSGVLGVNATSVPFARPRDEEAGAEPSGLKSNKSSATFQLDRYSVVQGLNDLRSKYTSRHAYGIKMRQELNVLFDDEVTCERIIAEMRQMSIRERYTAEVLTFEAMHFKDEQYKSHVFAQMQRLLNSTKALARTMAAMSHLSARDDCDNKSGSLMSTASVRLKKT